MLNQKKIYAVLMTSCLTFDLYAATAADQFIPQQTLTNLSPWVMTVGLGPVWENAGATQTFYVQPNIEKTYAANRPTNTLFNGEFFIGLHRTLREHWLGELGLAVAATSRASLTGTIWDDADQEFDNYTYTYHVQDTRLAVKGKLIRETSFHALQAYLSASFGVGFNQAGGYSSTPLIFQAIPAPNFSSNTTTTFAYTLGAGVQRAFNDHWQGGIGYEFADWGKSQLGRAPGQTLGTGLTLNHLYTNGLMIQLSYLS
jgi:opacity protein-like surface antigen